MYAEASLASEKKARLKAEEDHDMAEVYHDAELLAQRERSLVIEEEHEDKLSAAKEGFRMETHYLNMRWNEALLLL